MQKQKGTGETMRSIKSICIMAGGAFLCASIGILVWTWYGRQNVTEGDVDDMIVETFFQNPFTGERIASPKEDTRVACVMVENSIDAWPLSGVEEAFLVIEAPVEAKIPRLLACFTDDVAVEKIGPVRSARPYFIAWASGLHALYAHVGGSPEALEILKQNTAVTDLNEFWNGTYFWRDTTRFAPHNAYTATELLFTGGTQKELGYATSQGWSFFEQVSGEEQPTVGEDVEILWQEEGKTPYKSVWQFDEAQKEYVRFQGNDATPAHASSGKEYRVNNVVIVKTTITIIDEVGRRKIITEGTGDAQVCARGMCTDAVWKKATKTSPLTFFLKENPEQEIYFAPGKTWITVVSEE